MFSVFFLGQTFLPGSGHSLARCITVSPRWCARVNVLVYFVFSYLLLHVLVYLSLSVVLLVWYGVMMFCKVIIYIENGKVCDLYSGVHMLVFMVVYIWQRRYDGVHLCFSLPPQRLRTTCRLSSQILNFPSDRDDDHDDNDGGGTFVAFSV